MKRTWIIVAVAAAGALGGFAVTGTPVEVPDDLVITERPAPPVTTSVIGDATDAPATDAPSATTAAPGDTTDATTADSSADTTAVTAETATTSVDTSGDDAAATTSLP